MGSRIGTRSPTKGFEYGFDILFCDSATVITDGYYQRAVLRYFTRFLDRAAFRRDFDCIRDDVQYDLVNPTLFRIEAYPDRGE